MVIFHSCVVHYQRIFMAWSHQRCADLRTVRTFRTFLHPPPFHCHQNDDIAIYMYRYYIYIYMCSLTWWCRTFHTPHAFPNSQVGWLPTSDLLQSTSMILEISRNAHSQSLSEIMRIFGPKVTKGDRRCDFRSEFSPVSDGRSHHHPGQSWMRPARSSFRMSSAQTGPSAVGKSQGSSSRGATRSLRRKTEMLEKRWENQSMFTGHQSNSTLESSSFVDIKHSKVAIPCTCCSRFWSAPKCWKRSKKSVRLA